MNLVSNAHRIPHRKWLATSGVLVALTALLMSACAPKGPPPASVGSNADGTVDSSGDHAPSLTDDHLITGSAMGGVRLGMTLDEARRVLTHASFARQYDGDGMASVEASFGADDAIQLFANEESPDSSVDWVKPILAIQSFSTKFHTAEGVGPGSLVTDVVNRYGPIREITLSEIEQRQFIQFERQPQGLEFRLDYTGIFPPHESRTTRCAPGAKIQAIMIATQP
jgi:hypothetical protein